MELKQYQSHALHWLRRYYQKCCVMQQAEDTFPASTAFTSVTAEIHEGQGLPYAPVRQVPGIPYVCLRIPTGGGKTLVACEAVSLGVQELLQRDRALILWLVPSDAIRTQTLSRMQDRDDPYRQSLDTSLGNVAVLDIEEATRMKRALLDSHTVIVVATMQAFRRRDMSALNVYKNNGELMSHFENLPPELLEAVEREPEGHFNQSLVNVFRLRRPFVIIDEAHNARQPLSFETLRRLNPSAVLELTATPNLKAEMVKEDGESYENPPSNVLFSVSAYALKAEEMIKLPIYLRYREPWDALLGDAIGVLNHLDGEARQEEAQTGEYIRPIMLLQAQPEYKDRASITVETVEAKLKEFGIHESEICVHTGSRRGLDGINVQTRESKVRFIITVQALKEGWDCPWAYVLFSVAEMGSSKAVEQILGRVLRMPKAKRKQRDDLNNAYAFVASSRFDEAAKALKEGLVASGFEGQDVDDLVVERPLLPGIPAETAPPPDVPVTTILPDKPKAALPLAVVDVVTWNPKTGELTVAKPLNKEQEDAVLAWAGTDKAQAAVRAAVNKRAGRAAEPQQRKTCPAEAGVTFSVPVLALKQGDFLHQLEEDDILERNHWTLAKCDALLPSFVIPTEQRGISIDVNETEKIQQRFLTETDRQQRLLESSAAWPPAKLIVATARAFPHPGLTDAEVDIWLQRVISEQEKRGVTLEQMTAHRHRFFKAVAARVNELEKQNQKKVYETLLYGDGSGTVHVSLASVFTFDPQKYPVGDRYHGLELPRHYYKEIGAMNHEEIECARIIAHDERVETWVRNLEREPKLSFWIQTSTDKFYPDFLAKLKNGKNLAVEYKGGHLAGNPDTVEKERLGKLWEERSGGQCFFEMVKGPGDFAKIQDAIKKAAA
ncbi:DEAD/DEAH box helicase [Prosthecobacter fluviatilis]|uniref:DEAD/DEAH box helicase n=1 Tax=Prosthecobacter fluviatilis TaxID=445931 RepID=A0ABW0KX88_9BACT